MTINRNLGLKSNINQYTVRNSGHQDTNVSNDGSDQSIVVSEWGESLDNYHIYKRFELSNIGYQNLPFFFYILLSLDICLYLYLGLTSNTVIASTSLQNIISIIIYGNPYSLSVNYYYLIAGIFILIVIFLSFGTIASLKKFSILIIICRFLVIALILGCCIYSIKENGVSSYDEIPKFRIENITTMLGNSIFFFMIHYSIPGIIDSFKPQKRLMSLLLIGFLISLTIMIIYGFIALLAFSKIKDCDENIFPSAIKVVFTD